MLLLLVVKDTDAREEKPFSRDPQSEALREPGRWAAGTAVTTGTSALARRLPYDR